MQKRILILLASIAILILALVLFVLTLLVQPERLSSPPLPLILAGLSITGAAGFLANLKDVMELVDMLRGNQLQVPNDEGVDQELFFLLEKHFNIDELQELALILLGVEPDQLKGDTRNSYLISLIGSAKRHGMYEALLELVIDKRSHLEEKIKELTKKEELPLANKLRIPLHKPTLWVIGTVLFLVLFGIALVIKFVVTNPFASAELTPTVSSTSEKNQGSIPEDDLLSTPQFIPAPTTELIQEDGIANDEYIPVRIDDFSLAFVLVPEGVFEGSVDYPFYINAYEVSNREFANFMNTQLNKCSGGIDCVDLGATAVRITRENGQYVPEPTYEDYPVVEVTWYGANDYCNWIDGRLPSDIEWRKAATWHPISGEVFTYPWGNEPNASDFANVNGNALAPVDSFEQGESVAGAYNMFGNVWEFVSIEQGSQRLWYGGSWKSPTVDAFLVGSGEGRNTTRDDLGFRCVKDVN